jgi:hypothetical protein
LDNLTQSSQKKGDAGSWFVADLFSTVIYLSDRMKASILPNLKW